MDLAGVSRVRERGGGGPASAPKGLANDSSAVEDAMGVEATLLLLLLLATASARIAGMMEDEGRWGATAGIGDATTAAMESMSEGAKSGEAGGVKDDPTLSL